MGQKVMSKQINTREPVKGVLMSHTIMDLRIPLSYEVGLTPITAFGTGDTVTRTIQYSERKFSWPHSTWWLVWKPSIRIILSRFFRTFAWKFVRSNVITSAVLTNHSCYKYITKYIYTTALLKARFWLDRRWWFIFCNNSSDSSYQCACFNTLPFL